MFGIENPDKPDKGAYPRNQRTERMMIMVINIGYCVSISLGVIG